MNGLMKARKYVRVTDVPRRKLEPTPKTNKLYFHRLEQGRTAPRRKLRTCTCALQALHACASHACI